MAEEDPKKTDKTDEPEQSEVDEAFSGWPAEGEEDQSEAAAEFAAFDDRTPAALSMPAADDGFEDRWSTPAPALLDEPLGVASRTDQDFPAIGAEEIPELQIPAAADESPLADRGLPTSETPAQNVAPSSDGSAAPFPPDAAADARGGTDEVPMAALTMADDLASADPSAEPEQPLELDPLPIDRLPEGRTSWLTDFQLFQQETKHLARLGNWKRLAAVTGHVLIKAPFATRGTRTSLLLDLALLYRDRLRDATRAEQAFALLSREEPASAEALEYLSQVYEERAEWESIYDLLVAAVQATWAPKDRLEWTQRAAGIALEKLDRVDLAIKAWEQLWRLGDAMEEASRALARYYRMAGQWAEMADFLRQQAERADGAAQLVLLRELAEVTLSGLKSPDAASQVLESIVERSQQDPIAMLQLARVYAQRGDWDGLERLGAQTSAEGPDRDLQQLVADSLWQAGRLDQSIAAYDRILGVDPGNGEAIARKREYLTRTEKHAELLELLVESADSSDEDDLRVSLLEQAAKLAEDKVGDPREAISLWESKNAIAPGDLHGYEALVRLYEQVGDLQGIARTLSGQLALVTEREARIDLLRRLGDHCAARMGDDDRAEECWKEILSLHPTDLAAREDLIELHRRRGNFEALNSALLRQIWLTPDHQRAENLCRMAAENLDENFEAPERSVEAWHRVLDYAPLDLQSLQALARHYTALGDRRQQISVLEQQMRAVEEPQLRIDLGMSIARLWQDEGVARAAAASYERVVRLSPAHEQAREALVEIYRAAGQNERAWGLLDYVGAHVDTAERIALLRRGLELLPSDASEQRFWQLRRILWLSQGSEEVLDELREEARAAALWPELTAVLTQLAAVATDPNQRLQLLRELARICEQELKKRGRAYVVLQSALLSTEQAEDLLGELTRLAASTKRQEDLLALLDRLTTAEFDLQRRKNVLSQRADICEKLLDSPLRAFIEHRRRLELDPTDWSPLADLQRLCESHAGDDLWRRLDAAYGELWDRTPNPDRRLELLRRREEVAREQLDRPDLAFEFLLRRYRHDPTSAELLEKLIEHAEAQGGWDWLLPVLEASALAADEGTTQRDELKAIAALYQSKADDVDRAFVLDRATFIGGSATVDDLARLEALADETGQHDQLAATLRLAAATTDDRAFQTTLLKKIARLYEEKVKTPERAIDVHRRLLDLDLAELRSLEVMLDWHRSREQWRDLRDRLNQWLDVAPDDADPLPKLLEVAFISEQHLSDPEAALEAYGKVLEREPQHPEAKNGLESLVKAISEPALRKRWMQMQLRGATPDEALEIQLDIARIQEVDLQDVGGAIATLQQVVEQRSATSAAFKPLRRLLGENERYEDLVTLLQLRAEQLKSDKERLATLDEALSVCHERLGDGAEQLREQLYQNVLRLRPSDRDVRIRLARMLRNAERFEDLAGLLDSLPDDANTADRLASLNELARIHALCLDQGDRADRVYEQILAIDPRQEGALLARAAAARARGDHEAYIDLRARQAKLLEPTEGAFVLCHLAEVCDETPAIREQMVAFYREARALDPDNVPAMEALKGIGRRLKSLRPAAALLPLDGELELEPSERAARLRALGDDALATDTALALDWFRRAVAMAPNDSDNWSSLATALEQLPNTAAEVYRARQGWAQALERAQAPAASALAEQARRLYDLANAAKRANETEHYTQLVQRTFDLMPGFAPAALATAEAQLQRGAAEDAHRLLHEVLEQHRSELDDAQQVAALYGRGEALQRLDDVEGALRDFRDALRIDPLHANSLVSIGQLLAQSKRPAASMEHQVRALIALQDPLTRARQYFRLGLLLEDSLSRADEAGACYELALAEGLDERELLHRALRHLQRSGRLDESLDLVEGLLPTAEDPNELATLWLVRGEILAARDGCDEEAIEAFDMALSYDPSHAEARQGLVQVLERRGDWNQLLQVLEASCDAGSPEQRAHALHSMAAICLERLGSEDRAEHYLRQSVDAHPTADALQQLERLYSADETRHAERRDVLGHLVAFGPPWFPRCLELGKLLLVDAERWAWCMLSPLLGVSQIDASTKALLQGMRKDHERPSLRSPYGRDEHYALMVHPLAQHDVAEVLAELLETIPDLGLHSIDQAGDGDAIAIAPNTGLGRKFFALSEPAALPTCTLHRTQTLPEAVTVLNEPDGARIVVRTDVMQQLVHAEVGFLFGYALELAQPGPRTLAVLPPEQRAHLLPALWQALGFSDKTNRKAKPLAERITAALDDELRQRWVELLEPLRDSDPAELGQQWWAAVRYMARRAGLLAGADLRQAFRVVARIEEEITRPRVVARIEELDDYVATSDVLQDLVAFAASPAFGQLLRDTEVLEIE